MALRSETQKAPFLQQVAALDSQSHTPVTAYNPTGVHDSPLPMGKYYPSNYENRNQQPSLPAQTTKSESQVPRPRLETAHSRTDSDAKRRLQQYQRDMIAQATLAASEVLGRTSKHSGSIHATMQPSLVSISSTTTTPSLDGSLLKNVQLGGAVMRSRKPVSPRLAPLGSPGPVTPMDLEGGGALADGYMGRGCVPITGP
jgi:hypothetical protein